MNAPGPCPLCSSANVQAVHLGAENGVDKWRVICLARAGCWWGPAKDTADEAIAAWNAEPIAAEGKD